MKVFISSVISGFENERRAAAQAAGSLGYEARLAEDFPALSDSPQASCLAGVRWADAVVLLLGERYGAIQPSALSATHEEYREARDRCAVLAFVQSDVTPEPQQRDFIAEVQDYIGGRITDAFTTPEELQSLVVRALHELSLRRQAGATDENEITERARAALPHRLNIGGAVLSMAIACGPRQAIVRPARMEDPEFQGRLLQAALFGPHRVFRTEEGTERRLSDAGALQLVQPHAELFLDGLGTVHIAQALLADRNSTMLPAIIEEDLHAMLERSLAFVAEALDMIDAEHRLERVVPLAELEHAHQAWRTRQEQQESPNRSTVPFITSPRVTVELAPPGRHRSALRQSTEELADDLLVLLRRALAG